MSALAHVKWFIEEGNTVEPYSITEPAVLIWAVVIAVVLGLAWLNERYTTPWKKLVNFGNDKVSLILNGSFGLIGVWPIITALQSHVLVPTVDISSPLSMVGMVMILTGVFTVIPKTRPIGGVGFMLIWIYLVTQLGVLPALEHVFVVGIGILLVLAPRSVSSLVGTPLLAVRSLTGLSLVILAFQEKLLNPGLAQQFLVEYPYFNFMAFIGIEQFSDRLFILSSGMVELLIGILIIMGISTRMATAALTGVFITTALALGPQEVIGHLPLFGVAVLFLMYGNGKHLPK